LAIIKNHFTSELIDWFSKAKRDLPWRQTKDPYKIWLSEIILQQTRIDQGLPYYERFVEFHPNVHSLAACAEQDVLKLWEGLGYYSRARNLHATAKIVSIELGGVFPENYDGLIKLKGIGPYTAAAIASIAYDEAKPVVDGNVFRFISRYFGVTADITISTSRKVFEDLLIDFIPTENPGDFNQALMEFGATVCAPSPNCGSCVFREGCFGYSHQSQLSFPVKSKKVKVQEIEMNYIIFEHGDKMLLHSRDEGIWKGLFQFYLINESVENNLITRFSRQIYKISAPVKHLLTHRKLWVKFTHVAIEDENSLKAIAKELDLNIFSRKEVLNLPRPKVIVNYLEDALN
jgi:A/G-specific adenine glycosylase